MFDFRYFAIEQEQGRKNYILLNILLRFLKTTNYNYKYYNYKYITDDIDDEMLYKVEGLNCGVIQIR